MPKAHRAPQLYVIAGPNGAGKTTFARVYLPHLTKVFINADLIASGLSPLSPGAAAVEAGRIMLAKISAFAAQRRTFAFETTLSGRGYLAHFRRLRAEGYRISIIFLWLPNVSLAIERVKDRVRRGGHDVPEADIRRRFDRGVRNLLTEYHGLAQAWALVDNSGRVPHLIASAKDGEIVANDAPLFEQIKEGLK